MCQHFVERHPTCRSRPVRVFCFCCSEASAVELCPHRLWWALNAARRNAAFPAHASPLGATEHDDDQDGLCCPALPLMVHAVCPPDARRMPPGCPPAARRLSLDLLGLRWAEFMSSQRYHCCPRLVPQAPRSLRPLCFALYIKKHPPVQSLTPSPIRQLQSPRFASSAIHLVNPRRLPPPF